MRMLHLGLAAALLVGFTVSAEAAKEKGKKKGAGATGVVTAVTKDTITIKVHQGKKNKDAPAVEKTFNVTKTTTFKTFTKVKGTKGPGEESAAAFADVVSGKRVKIQVGADGTVETVSILPQGKKNKNK